MLEHRRMADAQPVLFARRRSSAFDQPTTGCYTTQSRSTLLDGCRWYRLWCSQQQGTQIPSRTIPLAQRFVPFFQIGVARRKGIDIITNETSQRATP